VAVIGAGLSGMMAAAAARRSGARVVLLADGHGALELASGCIDLLGATPAGPVTRPWEALAGIDAGHPYRLLGPERIRAALTAFGQIMADEGMPFEAAADESHQECNQWMATALGGLRPTYLRPASALPVAAGRPIWICGFRGLREFQPEVVAAGLQESLPGTPVTVVWVDLPEAVRHPVQLAHLLDRPQVRQALAQRLRASLPPGPPPALALFPAVLGIHQPEAVRAALAEAIGAPVSEVPLLSPSVPGLRLAKRLRRHLERSGVEVHLPVRVTGALRAGSRVERLTAETAGGPVEVRAAAYVLAAGGLLGQGLAVTGRRLVEPIFGLPVHQPGGPWAEPVLLPETGHPFVRAGVRTDAQLRPEGFTNLFVCGRMLAGYDPYGERSGGGVAIATGWYAGELAGGAAG
jgi:glycerol-3-phosphate dehydrogenase subunit B